MSKRETAILALAAAIRPALGSVPLLRDEARPIELPRAGLAILRTGETKSAEAILSPLSYSVEHEAELVLFYASSDAAARAAALDTMIASVVGAVVAARTLGGAVEWAQPGAPIFETDEAEGTTPVGAATLPIALWFTTPDSPAS